MNGTFRVSNLIGNTALSKRSGLKQIFYKDIEKNPDNFFLINDVNSLADSIENLGVQNPLLVIEKGDGKYMLISGHRRLEAIKILVEERDIEKFEDVPCIVLPSDMPDYMQDMILIETNTETRNLTDGEILEAVSRLKINFEKAKENGKPFAGKVRDLIAERMNISARTAQKYITIDQHADEETKEALKSGEKSMNEVYDEVKASRPMSEKEIDAHMNEINSELDELNDRIETFHNKTGDSDLKDDYDKYGGFTEEELKESTGQNDWNAKTRDSVTDPLEKTEYGRRLIDRVTGEEEPAVQLPDKDYDEPEHSEEETAALKKMKEAVTLLKAANIILLNDDLDNIVDELSSLYDSIRYTTSL